MTKSSPALNIPNKTLNIHITVHKPRTERYPKGSCYFATVKTVLKGFDLVLHKVHCGESIILILNNFSLIKQCCSKPYVGIL